MHAIFDLDGTLIDSAPDIHAAIGAAARELGLPEITLARARDFIGNGARVLVERYKAEVAPERGAEFTDEIHRVFLGHYAQPSGLAQPYAGVVGALDVLSAAGWSVSICTNKPAKATEAALKALGWDNRFAHVIAGDTLPVHKPDPAPLLEVSNRLGAGKRVFVGDSEVDAETAKAAGFAFALFTEGYRKGPVEAMAFDRAFSDWAELPAIAREIAR